MRSELSRQVLASAAAAFQIDPDLLHFVRDVANRVFSVGEGADMRFLRLTHRDDKTPAHVHAELEWMHFLVERGLPIARPIESVDGTWVVRAGESYSASCFERVRGEPIELADFDEPVFVEMGRFLGLLHRETASFQPADPTKRRPQWDECDPFDRVVASWSPDDRIVRNTWPRVHGRIEDALHARAGGLELIHGDLHRGNIYAHPDGIDVFDFDDSCYFVPAADIANAIFYSLWHRRFDPEAERERMAAAFLRALLEGYRSEHAIDSTDLALLPALLEYRELTVDAFSHRRWGAAPDDEATARWKHVRDRVARGAPYVALHDLASLFGA